VQNLVALDIIGAEVPADRKAVLGRGAAHAVEQRAAGSRLRVVWKLPVAQQFLVEGQATLPSEPRTLGILTADQLAPVQCRATFRAVFVASSSLRPTAQQLSRAGQATETSS
jgi:hypothetical protein